MTDGDQTITFSLNGDTGLQGRLDAYDDFAPPEDRQTDFIPGLVSLGFIRAAMRRGARFWCFTAVLGLFVGLGVYVSSPHYYQASTSVLLTLGPYEDVTTAASNDQVIAESRTVAALAVHSLGLQQSVSSFLSTYTATSLTDRILVITLSAPSANEAMSRASAVATAFLQFRAQELETEQKLVLQSLDQQVTQVTQKLNSIDAQISRVSSQLTSAVQQSQLTGLETQRAQLMATLTSLDQAVGNIKTSIQPATAAAVKGSAVLDNAAPNQHSRLKPLLLYGIIGLILGLVIGAGIVLLRALVSDALRRRDDVAHALGAPVKLSVGTVRQNRWLPGRGNLAAADSTAIRRIVIHLGRAVPAVLRGTATLAVVPVDNPEVPALSLVSLAVSYVEQGRQVVVADLCSGAPAARLLGAKNPGVGAASAYGGRLIVAVPHSDDVVPAGPLDHAPEQARRSSFTRAVAAACTSADVLLTLATLDPSLGGEHLSTWATDAVAVVTAGRSSWTKINGVGEMIRLSGARLVSGVLVGAESSDESLGVIAAPQDDRGAEVVERRSYPDASSPMAADESAHRPVAADPRAR